MFGKIPPLARAAALVAAVALLRLVIPWQLTIGTAASLALGCTLLTIAGIIAAGGRPRPVRYRRGSYIDRAGAQQQLAELPRRDRRR